MRIAVKQRSILSMYDGVSSSALFQRRFKEAERNALIRRNVSPIRPGTEIQPIIWTKRKTSGHCEHHLVVT